jgi:hypothetical protein
MDNPQSNQQVNKLLALLAFRDVELEKEEYKVLQEQPFRQWPKALQDKLRPFGAESIQ